MTFREVFWAVVSAMIVAVLFCARHGYMAGDYRQGVMLVLFALPFSLTVTIVLLLPAIAILKSLGATRVASYVLVPAAVVLVVYLAPALLNSSSYEMLNVKGKSLIKNGKVVWDNFGWMVLYHLEPAMWAALGGLLFWRLAVKGNPSVFDGLQK